MRSLFAVSILSILLNGCVSTKEDEAAVVEGADPVALTKVPNEPCPTPLVTPDADTKKVEQPSEAPTPAVVAEEKPLDESEPVKLEESTPAPDSAQELTPPPAAPEVVTTDSDRPDVRSHMDVEAVPPEIPDRRDYFVTTSSLNVRAEPSAQSAVVRQLRQGEKVTSWGREGIWVQIAENEYVSIIYLSDRQVAAQAGK